MGRMTITRSLPIYHLTPAGYYHRQPADQPFRTETLAEEGFIRGYTVVEHNGKAAEFEISLKYFEGKPVIRQIKRISTPGRRVYSSVEGLGRVQNGLGISILSTPKGVMSDTNARDNNVGGEILCEVF